MKAEALCFWQCLRFGSRHPRYLLIFLMLYAASFRRWRQMRAARLGYAFLQLFDDLMDDDRRSAETSDSIATRTIAEWQRGEFSRRDSLSRLAAAFHQALRQGGSLPEDRPEEDTFTLLQCMHVDARRRLERRIDAEDDLQQHLRQTFFHSVNLLLIGCGHRLRAREVPALVAALAWCSVIRDFAEDESKGLINVPREVLVDHPGDEGLASRPEVRVWVDRQRALGLPLLQACEREQTAVAARDPQAAKLIGIFARSMYKYVSA
jgi:hypothetical protein